MKKHFTLVLLASSLIFSSNSFAKEEIKITVEKVKTPDASKQKKNGAKKSSKQISKKKEEPAAVIAVEEKTVAPVEKASARSSSEKSNKTAGHYVGASWVMSHLKFNERYRDGSAGSNFVNVQPAYSENNFEGFDVNYKYAFNFDGIFVAPGVFFEKTNASADSNPAAGIAYANDFQNVKINKRYGLKADIGYDIDETFSPYVTGGYAILDYSTRNYLVNSSTPPYPLLGTHTIHATQGDWFYGLGVKANCSKNISLNLEYNRHSFLAEQTFGNYAPYYYSYQGYYKTRLDILKLGASYKF